MKRIKKILLSLLITTMICFVSSCAEEKIDVFYQIDFLVDGSIYHTTSVKENEEVLFPSAPTKEEHKFNGWLDENNLAVESLVATKDMTLKADFVINQYSITFDYDGGIDKNGVSQTTEVHPYGAKITAPLEPMKAGYTFGGWYLGEERYKFDTMPNENITLKAKWHMDEVVITFDSNGGTSVIQIIALPGTAITAPNDPYLKGCKFLGWYLNDELFEFNTMPKESITLKAKWQDTIYSINYEFNGGTCENLVTSYSSARTEVIDLPIPTKEGYSFLGWYTGAAMKGYPLFSLSLKMNKNLTLYAKWMETKMKTNTTFGVYGDSISTYEDYIPAGKPFYYPNASRTVKDVEKTWWRILQNQTGLEMIRNISISSSAVSDYGPDSGIKTSRIKSIINGNGIAPDVLIIMMGCNDVVNGVSAEDFDKVYREMLDKMKELCPNMDIIICDLLYNTCTDGQNPDPKYDKYTHPGLRDAYNVVLAKIAADYNYPLIKLSNVITEATEAPNNWYLLDDNMHPSDKGMQAIADEITKTILELY